MTKNGQWTEWTQIQKSQEARLVACLGSCLDGEKNHEKKGAMDRMDRMDRVDTN